MAKTREKKKSKKSKRSKTAPVSLTTPNAPTAPTVTVEYLLQEAADKLQTGSTPAEVLKIVERALEIDPHSLPALECAAEIHVEMGEIDTARSFYMKAAEADPDGNPEEEGGSGPEKFLWLAQLSAEGGMDAVRWYEKGLDALRRWMGRSDAGIRWRDRGLPEKTCSALCGLTELFMTDLCMEEDAEQRCEAYISEAMMVGPDNAEVLQTLASVRISQERVEDAKAALERSMSLWRDLEPMTMGWPSYANRIALVRLLVEVEEFEAAIGVLEQLQDEDDQVVDVWYLGGWCLYLYGKNEKESGREEIDDDGNLLWKNLWDEARDWLLSCQQVSSNPLIQSLFY